jgi:pyruvate,water dikinase
LSEELATLDAPTRERVLAGEIELLPSGPAFLERFGHVSGSGNDFSSVPWREEPARIAALLSASEPAPASEGADGQLAGLSRFDGLIAGRTVRYRFERERVSYLYTRAYGRFRPAVQEVARRLVERGRLDQADDVFGLTRAEMESGLLDGAALDLRELAGPRLREMDELAEVEMPEVIFGDEFTPAPPSDPEHTLAGIPSSRGVQRSRARVVSGVDEASKVERGDIVVIPYSDVGWTPMLARAGGIVAESGGLLSHSSIVAREFGIPCVVSVSGAMRIPDGSVVRVDGFTGDVHWEPAG